MLTLRFLDVDVIPWQKLSYLPRKKVWMISSLEHSYEIVIFGDETGPTTADFAIAKEVSDEAEAIVSAAVEHLDTFIDRSRIGGAAWFLDGFVFGGGPRNEFEVQMSLESDSDGLWIVTFRRMGGGWWPFELLRRTQ